MEVELMKNKSFLFLLSLSFKIIIFYQRVFTPKVDEKKTHLLESNRYKQHKCPDIRYIVIYSAYPSCGTRPEFWGTQ